MLGIISILISSFVTAILYFLSKIDNPRNIEGIFLLVQVSGLGASILMSWNFILATRLKFIERIFGGLDKVYKIHNILGNFVFILAINHPIFLLISSLPYNSSKLYLVPNLANIPYALGIISLYLLIIFVSLTIFMDLPYKLWKKTHEYMGLVIILASLHSILVTSDISFYLPLKIWMIFINAVAIICYLYKRFAYYLFMPKNNYSIINITQEKDYLMLDLLANDPNKIINFDAGQFAFISQNKDKRDEHPFSILDQVDGNLKLGTKIVGPFTISLANLRKGSHINVFGPFGSFSENLSKAKKIVFISGGIGITPFYSMLKSVSRGQEVIMIHSSRTNESTLFTNLFIEYQKTHSNFKFFIHNSDTDGHLNYQIINKYCFLNTENYVYICGPKKMMEDVSMDLTDNGLLQKRIIYEDFTFK
jgi:predicted ferric reductase